MKKFIKVFLVTLAFGVLLSFIPTPNKELRCDYHVEISNNSMTVHTDDEMIGKVPIRWNSPLDSLIEEDNKGDYIIIQNK